MIKKNNFLIKCDEKEIDLTKIENIYQKVKEFFDIKEDILIRVIICSTKEDFIFYTGIDEPQEWMIGRAIISSNTIAVYSPEAIEKYTKKNKNDFDGLIAHELSHIVYHHLGYTDLIELFNEGIAKYVQNVLVKNEPVNYTCQIDQIDIFQEFGKSIYKEGLFIVHEIISKLGKERLFELLNKISKEDRKEYILETYDNLIKKEL